MTLPIGTDNPSSSQDLDRVRSRERAVSRIFKGCRCGGHRVVEHDRGARGRAVRDVVP
jgi:hypothetical protein